MRPTQRKHVRRTTPDPGRTESFHESPQFLSDGEHFLFVVGGAEEAGVHVASLSAPDERKLVLAMSDLSGLSTLRYVAGHLCFVRDGALMMQTFDERALAVTGEPVRIADGVQTAGSGGAPFSVSDNGVLAFFAGVFGEITQAARPWIFADRKPIA